MPVWDQVTLPVGEYPITLAVQMMIVDEPAAADFGAQETVVFETFFITVRPYVPGDWKFLVSPA